MPKYLVTGGAGFIGSHLCEALRAHGHAVRVVDDFSTGKRENLPDGVESIAGDITDPYLMQHAVEGVAGCYHLAAIASVARGLTDWVGTHRVNLTGTITLFEALSRRAERVPVVYASSAAVYGSAQPPTAEEAPKRPLSAYGADKYACELHAAVASLLHGIPTVGLRFFNVYGPRQDPASPYSGVISIFCDKRLHGLPIDIFGNGEQTRDFIYVTDVVKALLAAMAQPSGNAVYNVCTGRATSVLDLAHVINDLLGHAPSSHIRHQRTRAGDIRHSRGSPVLVRQVFGLDEPVLLYEGLKHVLDSLRQQ